MWITERERNLRVNVNRSVKSCRLWEMEGERREEVLFLFLVLMHRSFLLGRGAQPLAKHDQQLMMGPGGRRRRDCWLRTFGLREGRTSTCDQFRWKYYKGMVPPNERGTYKVARNGGKCKTILKKLNFKKCLFYMCTSIMLILFLIIFENPVIPKFYF